DEIALDLMKFIAVTTGYGKSSGSSAGFSGKPTAHSAEEYADALLQLFERCRGVIKGKQKWRPGAGPGRHPVRAQSLLLAFFLGGLFRRGLLGGCLFGRFFGGSFLCRLLGRCLLRRRFLRLRLFHCYDRDLLDDRRLRSFLGRRFFYRHRRRRLRLFLVVLVLVVVVIVQLRGQLGMLVIVILEIFQLFFFIRRETLPITKHYSRLLLSGTITHRITCFGSMAT